MMDVIFAPEFQKRFWAKVDKTAPSGCWEWTTALCRLGYARIRVGRKMVYAHRISYILAGNSLPDTLTIDHLCRNRKCVNPEHLDAVTLAENKRRAQPFNYMKQKTHCPNGHPYEGDNFYTDSKGWRKCRICRRAKERKALAANPELAKRRMAVSYAARCRRLGRKVPDAEK